MRRPKFNRITATGIKGIYKDQPIEIEIGETSAETNVKVNGKKLKNVIGAHIHMRAGETTKLILETYKRN